MNIALFGIQGSGKGTQARMLLQEQDFFYFEAGQALRTIVASGSELGKEVGSYIDNGELVPSQLMVDVFKDAVQDVPLTTSLLLDGIPRFAEQKNQFEEVMQTLGREYHCIQFTLSKSEALQRIAERGGFRGAYRRQRPRQGAKSHWLVL